MAISNHISFKDMNNVPPPPHKLRRCWNQSYLEELSIIEYNRKYIIRYMDVVFEHVNEIRFNKYIEHQYRCGLNYIFIKEGKYNKKTIVNKVLSYIVDVNNTSITRVLYPSIFGMDK